MKAIQTSYCVVGGAAVATAGGLLFGPPGAIVGAMIGGVGGVSTANNTVIASYLDEIE